MSTDMHFACNRSAANTYTRITATSVVIFQTVFQFQRPHGSCVVTTTVQCVVTGLVASYRQRVGWHRLLRKLLVLPLLPAEHMRPAFDAVTDRVPPDVVAVTHLLSYVRDTWLENATWKPANLSAYCQQVKTNNDVDGWHRRLNQKARRGKLPLYMLLRLLHAEAQTVGHQVRLLSDGRLRRYARKKYTDINGRLWKLWEQYASGERTTSSLLRAASHLQLPNTMEDQ